jgi:hypothetical protein
LHVICGLNLQVLNIRCLGDAQRLMVVDDKGKILYATSPLAALLSTKVLALVNTQMQALLPPPAAQMHKLWMKVRGQSKLAGQHG